MVLVALFAAGLATFELLYSTQALLPELSRDFEVSTQQSTLTLSLSTLGLAFALLVAGPVSEVVGRTRMIKLSVAASSVIGLACAIAPTWDALLALRLLEGVALAGLPAVATAYLREELHPSTHARAAGLYVGGTGIGGMLGRLVTGGVAELVGWRMAMAAAAVVGLTCALVVHLSLPDSQHFESAPRGRGVVRTMARRALSDPVLLALYGIGACGVGALISVFNTIGFRLAAPQFALGIGAASLVFLVYPLGTVGAAVAGVMADRLGRRAVLPIGSVIALAGVALTASAYLPAIVLGVALLTIGFFVTHGVASGWVPARAHAGGVATAQAASFYLVSYYFGASVFGTLSGIAWTHSGWAGVALLSGGLITVTGLIGLMLQRMEALGLPAASGR
ncbi:MFS transporter [Nocardioides sp. Root614]|nr:MFS transporter [Nocardioides sp. Root614]KRA87698.1 MFS transporter [Nocardioides sp. Root682]